MLLLYICHEKQVTGNINSASIEVSLEYNRDNTHRFNN